MSEAGTGPHTMQPALTSPATMIHHGTPLPQLRAVTTAMPWAAQRFSPRSLWAQLPLSKLVVSRPPRDCLACPSPTSVVAKGIPSPPHDPIFKRSVPKSRDVRACSLEACHTCVWPALYLPSLFHAFQTRTMKNFYSLRTYFWPKAGSKLVVFVC